MKYAEAGTYHLHYTAVDECGNETKSSRTIEVKSEMTVLFEDGTLIINEKYADRETNVTEHGAVVKEYPPAPYEFETQADIPWIGEKGNILLVKFGSPVNQTSCMRLFNELNRARSIDLTNLTTTGCTTFERMFSSCNALFNITGLKTLDTSSAVTMEMMFYGCNTLGVIDCSGFDTSKVTHMGQMFRNNYALFTIYASDKFVVEQVTQSGNMFAGDNSLVGGGGTPFSASQVNKTYARIDNPPHEPGYFTRKV